MYLIIDTGMTSTRVNLIDENNRLVGRAVRTAGVRNTTEDGSNQKIKDAILHCFQEIVETTGINPDKVQYAIGAGMISSEIGLVEVPHVIVPAGLPKFSQDIKVIRDPAVFPLDMPIAFIRGVKNTPDDFSWDELSLAGVTRGEEVQCMGVMKKTGMKGPFNLFIFSTATKLISVNEKSEIYHILTTASGSYYRSVAGKDFGATRDGYRLDEEFCYLCDLAYKNLNRSAFLQAANPMRMLQVFNKNTTAYQRDMYLNALLAADECRLFPLARELGYDLDAPFVLLGPPNRCQVAEYMVNKILPQNSGITVLSGMDEMYDATVQGIISVVSQSDMMAKLRALEE